MISEQKIYQPRVCNYISVYRYMYRIRVRTDWKKKKNRKEKARKTLQLEIERIIEIFFEEESVRSKIGKPNAWRCIQVYFSVYGFTVREGSGKPEIRVLLERNCRDGEREQSCSGYLLCLRFFFSFFSVFLFFSLFLLCLGFPFRHCNQEVNSSHSDRTWVHLFFLLP